MFNIGVTGVDFIFDSGKSPSSRLAREASVRARKACTYSIIGRAQWRASMIYG